MSTTPRHRRRCVDQIVTARPRCPRCATLLKIRTSRDQGDGSRLAYSTCPLCGRLVAIILE